MNALFRSKRATISKTLGMIIGFVFALALIALGIYLLVTKTALFGESIGCEGTVSQAGPLFGGELYCHEAPCPGGDKQANQVGLNIASPGCGKNEVCCIGEKPEREAGEGGRGVIEVREKDKEGRIRGENKNNPYEVSTGEMIFTVEGTQDIMYCEVNLWTPEGDKIELADDDTECNPDPAEITAEFEQEGTYEFDVIGYNSKDQRVESTKIYMQTETSEETEPAGEGAGEAEEQDSAGGDEVIFELYNYIDEEGFFTEPGETYYETSIENVNYDIYCSSGAECRLNINGETVFDQNNYKEGEVSDLGMYTLNPGLNTFTIVYKSDGTTQTEYYTVNLVEDQGGAS